MIQSGVFGLGVLIYSAWKTSHFLKDGNKRVWAKRKYFRYLPKASHKSGEARKDCSRCLYYVEVGFCGHPEWLELMGSDGVFVKPGAHCELWARQDLDSVNS